MEGLVGLAAAGLVAEREAVVGHSVVGDSEAVERAAAKAGRTPPKH